MTLDELTIAVAGGMALALAGSAHCAAMCGPISVVARERGGRQGMALYFVGRMVSYALLGSLAGSIGHVFYTLELSRWLELSMSWLLGASLLLAALREFNKTRASGLVQLGRRARSNRLGRLLVRVADEPLLLGALTAMLPCGMLYSAVLAAAALGTALQGAIAMGAFATLSGLLLGGVAELSMVLTLGRHGRRILASAMVIGAVILFARPLANQGRQRACHATADWPAQEQH